MTFRFLGTLIIAFEVYKNAKAIALNWAMALQDSYWGGRQEQTTSL
jgi:hypothetical protein